MKERGLHFHPKCSHNAVITTAISLFASFLNRFQEIALIAFQQFFTHYQQHNHKNFLFEAHEFIHRISPII
jgi:hypothetical protein